MAKKRGDDVSPETEPSLEATANEVVVQAEMLHQRWQQPPTELVIPPAGVWSKLEAARSTYPEVPAPYSDLSKLFPQRFITKDFRQGGEMSLETAHAFEVARRSKLFGGNSASIQVFANTSVPGSQHLLIVGAIYPMGKARLFEIAREGDWTYEGLAAKRREADAAVPTKTQPKAPVLRHVLFWIVAVAALVVFIIAMLSAWSVIAWISLAAWLVIGWLVFFSDYYKS